MWVRSADGMLVNLDRCILVRGNGKEVWAVENCEDESAVRSVLFRGSPEDCGLYIDTLASHLLIHNRGIVVRLHKPHDQAPGGKVGSND